MTRRLLGCASVAGLLVVSASTAMAAPPAGQDEHWSHWQLFTVVRSLATDGEALWVGTDHGLMRYDPETGERSVYDTSNGLLSSIVLFVSVGPDGTVWAGSAGGGLSKFEENRWISYTPYGFGTVSYGNEWTRWSRGQGIGDLWVYNVAFDSDGTMWAATWKGLSRFDGQSFHTFTVDDGLVDRWVYALAIDQQGRIWCGTEGGVTRYDPDPVDGAVAWKSWTHADGVGAPVEAVAADVPEESLYDGGDHHAAAGTKDISRPANPNYISSALFDREGRLWVGTLGGGLSRFDGRTWTNLTMKDGLSGDVVYAIAQDRQGQLWIGTNNGVSRYDFERFTNFQKEDGLLAGAVYAVAVDGNGHKWFGSYGQLSRYTGN